MSVRPATLARIEGAHRFSAFYRGYLANHLPMALVALDAMGADDAAIERFESRYVASHLEPIAAVAFEIAPGAEARHFGDAAAFAAWVAYFEKRIRAEGVTAVLHAVLDPLMASVESGAFHGAIRTAYALESGSSREMAHALAYWSAAREAPLDLPAMAGTQSPTEVLRALSADGAFAGRRAPGRNILMRTRATMGRAEFRAHVERTDLSRLSLDTLAHATIRAYAATGDFTVLHAVTGCHAVRMLIRYTRERDAAVRRLWVGLAAAYAGEGAPAIDGWRLEGSDALDWPEIHRRAALCDDEHDVKLAYTCWREWQETGDDLYRRVGSALVCHALAEVEAC
jgi:questin oxidase-like protein